jgi:integrase
MGGVRGSVTIDMLREASGRATLSPRDWPYWLRIGRARFLGYFRPRHGSGTWQVQFGYVTGRRTKYRQQRLGLADDEAPSNGDHIRDFDQALGAAKHVIAVNGLKVVRANFEVSPDRLLYCPVGPVYTVGHAMLDYLKFMLLYRKSAASTLYISNRHILPKLGTVSVAELTPDMLREWFGALSSTPAARGTGKPLVGATADDLRRRKVAANRVLSVLTAALNLAFRDGKASDDRVWRRVRKHKVHSIRQRFLTEDEARHLLAESPSDFWDLVHAALCTGCRESELIRMRLDAFDPEHHRLYVAPGKNGRERWLALPQEATDLFRRLIKGRVAPAPMSLTTKGQPWTNGLAGDQMRAVRARLCLGKDVVFHTLRHTHASYLVMAGAPLLAVMKLLGPSSLDQVIRYAHLSPDYLAEAVLEHFPPMLSSGRMKPKLERSGLAELGSWSAFTGHPAQRAARAWTGRSNPMPIWMRA